MPTAGKKRPPRRDAVRNRARLVAAAAEAFREEGLGASVNAIARRADVNVATLYRHFPTKQQLIVAVLETVLEPLEAWRDQALETAEDGGTLAAFLVTSVREQARFRGLVDVLGRYPVGAETLKDLGDRSQRIVAPVVERAHRSGELRREADARDVLIALRMLTAIAADHDVSPDRLDRHVDIVLRGLRPG